MVKSLTPRVTRIALLLVVGCLLEACPMQLDRRDVPVGVLVVRSRINPQSGRMQKSGGILPGNVRLEPNETGKIRVGIFEDSSLGAGNMWRATIWMAAFQAAMATNQPLKNWRIAVEVDTGGTRIDGPSAGGLLTTAMMAGMTGQPVNPLFTMTGTINPDGSIGPVGGIPLKIAGAIRKGRRILGYPNGQRFQKHQRTGKVVDLNRAFAHKGVQVREIKTVFDAYQLMTGTHLARPKPLSHRAMALPNSVNRALSKAAQGWIGSAVRKRSRFRSLGMKGRKIRRRWSAIEARIREAKQLLRRGNTAAANWRAEALHIEASRALILAQLWQDLSRKKLTDALAKIRDLLPVVRNRLNGLIAQHKRAQLSSSSDLMTKVDSYGALIEGQRLFELSRKEVKHSMKQLTRLVPKILRSGQNSGKAWTESRLLVDAMKLFYRPIKNLILAHVQTYAAEDRLTFRGRTRGHYGMSHGQINRLAKVLETAARANLNYFEATTVTDRSGCKRKSFPDEKYQSARMSSYIVSSRIAPKLGRNSADLKIAKLAAAFSVYLNSAMLISKYYSLKFRTGRNGTITEVKRKKAFYDMLRLAERMAREHAAHALTTGGEVPIASKVAYQIAYSLSKERNYRDQVEALNQFWRSSLFSQLAVMLRR